MAMPREKTTTILAFIEACHSILQEIQPASVRATAYQLFVRHLLPSMENACTNKVSSPLVYAREHSIVPWEWIVDEAREGEREAVGQRLVRRAPGKVTGRMRGCWFGLVACVLLTGCGLAFPRLSTDSQKPTVNFATPAAWGCARQTQTLPTPKGILESCTVCQNIARTGQGVTINKEAHTVPPQDRVAMCESSAFVTAE
jgi:hypothetical protein